MIVNKLSFAGASDLQVDQGTIMTFYEGAESFVKDGSKSVKFTATGGSNQPTIGVSYSTFFEPKPATYQEVLP